MGYTVYWNASPDVSLEASAPDLQQLINMGPTPDSRALQRVPLAGPTGTGNPVFDGCRLQFNGAGHDSHESFIIGGQGEHGFGFCKTERKPYDAYVKAALVLIQLTLNDSDDLRISCDGAETDWIDAMILVSEIRGSIIPGDVKFSQEVLTPNELSKMVHSFHV